MISPRVVLADRIVELGEPCVIVAEVAQSHDGSLGTAHAFIDAVANSGADAIKFQTHIADAESTLDEPWRVKFSFEDKTRYDYWKRMEFAEEEWKGLKEHADNRGLMFLSSPFSIESVELLKRIGVTAWKIASGEVTNTPMLGCIAETGLPVLLSTGMSPVNEIDEAVESIRSMGLPLVVLQCTSMYPTPPEKVGLNMITHFRERYGCPVGISDHSGAMYTALAAVTLGSAVIEVHVTLSREMFGPDIPVSLTTSELKQLVEGVRFIERILSNPVDKNAMAEELRSVRELFMKSVVARADLAAETIVRADHLTVKKPGTGIRANRLYELSGRRLIRDVRANQMLKEEDLYVSQ